MIMCLMLRCSATKVVGHLNPNKSIFLKQYSTSRWQPCFMGTLLIHLCTVKSSQPSLYPLCRSHDKLFPLLLLCTASGAWEQDYGKECTVPEFSGLSAHAVVLYLCASLLFNGTHQWSAQQHTFVHLHCKS